MLRQQVRLYLLLLQDHIARDPDRSTRAAVVMQVSVAVDRRPSLFCGEGAAPPTAPRRSIHELVALALEDLDGDRQLNRALHTIIMIRERYHQPTRRYVARRTAEGKSVREIHRCLKRTAARQLFRLLERQALARVMA
jgi:hypothetical protein